MKVFSPAHLLRHVSMPTLKDFTLAHVLGPELAIDWELTEEALTRQVCEAVRSLEVSLKNGDFPPEKAEVLGNQLHLWQDDLRRIHLMSNELASCEFRAASDGDPEVTTAFQDRGIHEQAMWMFTHREKRFRDTELHMAFQAKANGKYWKKHRIEAGLSIIDDRDKLEAFSTAVAKLYEKEGAGRSTHVEFSNHALDASIQVTLYVEGPVTALAHFTDNRFKRLTTRIALETALVYHPDTGQIESVVKGGAKNHVAVLELFGQHVLGQKIAPEEIERVHYDLNVLRDGNLETFEDLSPLGVEGIRVRRAKFAPRNTTGIFFQVEASPDREQEDAIQLALGNLKVHHAFEAEYNLVSAALIIYMKAPEGQKPKHFSFNLQTNGASTIKNLPDKNQTVALAVLTALNVVHTEGASA